MRATALLTDLAACLCATITDTPGVGEVCFCGVIPGDGVVTDYAGCSQWERNGMAWVRQTLMYPASGIDVVNTTVNNCASLTGMDIELGMVRPVAVVDDRGNPPTPEEYEAAAAVMNDDAEVMLAAVQCCDRLHDLDYILGTYQPFGPLGGVVGGTWSVAVVLD